MKYTTPPARILRAWLLFIPLISSLLLHSQPAVLSGIVTNVQTGQPIIGAKITAGAHYTYSLAQGAYSMEVEPGIYNISCTKPGYTDYSSPPLEILPDSAVVKNILLWEAANPPPTVDAVIDSTVNPPAAVIAWDLPSGEYEIIYDDGIQDDFTVWAVHGNMNAVKFTPAGYPATITGGSVNIGDSTNYQPGSNPFVPFQVVVYDASGPGGTPGIAISQPLDVLPSAFGWITFTFPDQPVINSGNYYLVMIQGGNSPNASGLAVDKTNSQFRSYSRFVSGTGGWLPADGNFMIRSVARGAGGPLLMTQSPSGLTGYHAWRLRQGEELNPAVWTDLGTTTLLTITDTGWPVLPCGPYRWSVKAIYTGNRLSDAAYSNVIGKCWTVPVRIDVTLSCTTTPVEGTEVRLKNLVYEDTIYNGVADTAGRVQFYNVWKGSYEIDAARFGYVDYAANAGVISDTIFPVMMFQEKNPATGLIVNSKSLQSAWIRPKEVKEFFSENWDNGSFTANGWTTSGGVNWIISSGMGNPEPSAMFTWSPPETNYNESLTSRIIGGENAPVMMLDYDIFLDNFGTTTMNQLAVEIWDGLEWHTLKNYDNQSGDIPWTTEKIDISTYSSADFRIRFRAYGENTYDINNWNIDNISCTGSENASTASCVLGYFVYLNNILCGFAEDTTFMIPPSLVDYGSAYTACVVAAYGSGYSAPDCYDFISGYLPPPTGLAGQAIENAAYLTWYKPEVLKKAASGASPPEGLLGYNIYRDTVLIHFIADPDSLEYYDMNLYPDVYSYEVSAKYDLTFYGFPGQFDESARAGPVEVDITYGRTIPFYEPWDQGTFSFNEWSFDPSQDNWFMDMDNGNPLPSAAFSSQPPMENYSSALVSPVLNAGALTCANIWLDFDLRLLDHALNGKEQLSIELFFNNAWHQYAGFSNFGDITWFPAHINISPVAGKAFIIRFRAHGLTTENIQQWNIDNIHVYGICNPPSNLAGDAAGLDVNLTWSPPDCYPGHLLEEGFEGSLFPPEYWTQVITDTANTWYHSDASTPWGVHAGNWSASLKSDYSHQDEWLIANDIYISGNLTFWSYAFQGSVHGDHYLVQISENNGATWITLGDLSSLPPYPSSSGYNEWTEPYTFDLSAYSGEVLKIAWHAFEENGQGLWYNWAIDDCTVGDKKIALKPEEAGFLGYDIYRSDGGSGNFAKINGSPVNDTMYTDPGLIPGQYDYYVVSVYEECSSFISSDTTTVDVITGLPGNQAAQIKIFPNPATSAVSIISPSLIYDINVINMSGQLVCTSPQIMNNEYVLSLAGIRPGVYILKIQTSNSLYISRLSIVN